MPNLNEPTLTYDGLHTVKAEFKGSPNSAYWFSAYSNGVELAAGDTDTDHNGDGEVDVVVQNEAPGSTITVAVGLLSPQSLTLPS